MNKQYKKEKFESRDSCLIWVADDKPIYNINDVLYISSDGLLSHVNDYWQEWNKAVEIVPEKRTIEAWVNVYEDDSNGLGYTSVETAEKCKELGCIGTIKLSKEITIVDGKLVEDE